MEELPDWEECYSRNEDRFMRVMELWRKRVSKPMIGILLEACRQAGAGEAAESIEESRHYIRSKVG